MACGWVYLCAIVDWASRKVLSHRVSISMDGKGAWRDNVFVERLWRSIKYEEVYLHACDSVGQAKAGIARYISFHNTTRPHSSLGKKTPDGFYSATLTAIQQAAGAVNTSCPPRRSAGTSQAPTDRRRGQFCIDDRPAGCRPPRHGSNGLLPMTNRLIPDVRPL